MKVACRLLVVAALATGGPLLAQPGTAAPAITVLVDAEAKVPVFAHDITDRPYEVIGEVQAEVRKATAFSKKASRTKIYKELWERGEKLNADAVINASYGKARITAISWGSIKATGTAIRFRQVPEVAAAAPAMGDETSER